MLYRLKIAVSVFFGVLAVALLVFWARSYWTFEIVSRVKSDGTITTLGSAHGDFHVFYSPESYAGEPAKFHGWRYESAQPNNRIPPRGWTWNSDHMRITVPIWALAVLAAGAACVQWPTFRFSLRTLLLATTLVAVVLGLVCYAVR